VNVNTWGPLFGRKSIILFPPFYSDKQRHGMFILPGRSRRGRAPLPRTVVVVEMARMSEFRAKTPFGRVGPAKSPLIFQLADLIAQLVLGRARRL